MFLLTLKGKRRLINKDEDLLANSTQICTPRLPGRCLKLATIDILINAHRHAVVSLLYTPRHNPYNTDISKWLVSRSKITHKEVTIQLDIHTA